MKKSEYEIYITGTGQKLKVHTKDKCTDHNCCIHNSSYHPLRNCPTHWRDDLGTMERICKHGIGHPDPDDLAFKNIDKTSSSPDYDYGEHSCDGCCIKN